MEFAVIGSGDFIKGFRLLGIRKVFEVRDEDLEGTIESVLGDAHVGILVLHDDSLKKIPQAMVARLHNSIHPVLITVGHEEEDLRLKIRRAMGIDLYAQKR